jgi:AraC-like DNA-binding protein
LNPRLQIDRTRERPGLQVGQCHHRTALQSAIQRLTRSDEAIAAIAYDVGFDNPTAFHHAFRQWTGSTAVGYRHRNSG